MIHIQFTNRICQRCQVIKSIDSVFITQRAADMIQRTVEQLECQCLFSLVVICSQNQLSPTVDHLLKRPYARVHPGSTVLTTPITDYMRTQV